MSQELKGSKKSNENTCEGHHLGIEFALCLAVCAENGKPLITLKKPCISVASVKHFDRFAHPSLVFVHAVMLKTIK